MKTKLILTHPPVSSPWHVPAGTTILTGLLHSLNHSVLQRFGHIIGLEYVLKQQNPELAQKCFNIIRNSQSTVPDFVFVRQNLANIASTIETRDKFAITGNNVLFVGEFQDGTLTGAINTIQNRKQSMWYQYFADVEIPVAREFCPQIYGVSICDERQLVPGLILASMIKDELPGTTVLLGGNFWSRMEHLFNYPEFTQLFEMVCHAVCFTEGFQPLVELANTQNIKTTPGLVWIENGKVKKNHKPLTSTKFEDLPKPQFDGGAKQWCPDDVFPLYTASNCPTECSFCAIAAASDTFRSAPRVMSPRRIAEHMKATGASRFDITDETFTPQRQIALGKELRGIEYRATWQCYLTVTNNLLNPDLAIQLYEAGCRAVQLGLETLSPETLKRENKTWNTPANYGRILRNLKSAGIQVHVFIIVGLPGEKLSWTLAWIPFFEEFGGAVLTVKPGRYRLARKSPEATDGVNSDVIEVLEDSRPLHLNLDFRYKGGSSRKKMQAMRTLLNEACRRHKYHSVTSNLSWWANRGRFSWRELEILLPPEPGEKLDLALTKAETIIREELGIEIKFDKFEELADFARKQF
ncbi:MAG: radical SAM protein [Patescibacteria group bacterium]